MIEQSQHSNRVVADGRRRALDSDESRRAWAKIEARIRKKYAARIQAVGMLGRIRLAMRRTREIARRRRAYNDKTAPDHALYLRSSCAYSKHANQE